MAESDPRKTHPAGRRADLRDSDSEEDPLVELARIVSEDSGFQGGPAAQPQPRKPAEITIDRNAFSANLESELLQELESSFAPRRAAPRPVPSPIEAPPTDEADDLLRSIEAQLGEFERRAQTARPARVVPVEARDETEQAFRAEPPPVQDEPAPRRAPAELGQHPASPRRGEALPRLPEGRERSAAPRPTMRDRLAARPERQTDVAAPPPYQPPRSSPVTPEERDMPARLPLRRRDTPVAREASRPAPTRDTDRRGGARAGSGAGWSELDEAAAPAAPGTDAAGWDGSAPLDYRQELRTTFGEIDEAREPVQDSSRLPGVEAELRAELEAGDADPALGGEWQGGDDDAGDAAADEPRVAAAGPLNSGRRTAAREDARRRPRRGLMAAAGLLAVVALGGGVLAWMGTGGEVADGPPPVIAAPPGEVKIQPPRQQAAVEGETVGDAVYGRVAGDAPQAEEQVVDAAEEPREIARIVLPPPQAESDAALVRDVGDANATEASNSAEDDGPVGPRRVRTYVVRPDGTIISAAAEAPAGPAPAAEFPAAGPAVAIEPVPVRTTAISDDGVSRAVVRDEDTPPTASVTPAPAQPVAPETPAGSPEDSVALAAPESAPARPEPSEGAPVDLLTAAPAAPPPAAAASGGYVVQVSSQRSQAEAESSLADLKRRYASLLADLPSDIQEADVPGKGTYFRARVGGWETRSEAIEVCEALKAAGGNCLVAR